MPYADTGDTRLFYGEYGEGDPLIFLHGFTLDRRMWQAQAEFFSKYYRVILVDARGHGLSDAPQTGYSRAHRVEDLRKFADNLKIDRFHLVGLSMGGSTALGAALTYPNRLKSVTLVSTGAAGYKVGKRFSKLDQVAREKGYEAVRDKWMKMSLLWFKEDNDIKSLMETMISEHSGAPWTDPMRGKYPRESDMERVAEINLPTMIIAGQSDKAFVRLSELLHQRIDGSQYLKYDNVGHMVNLEKPTRFIADLKAFLEGESRP